MRVSLRKLDIFQSIFSFLVLLIFISAAFIQSRRLLGWDVAWTLEVAKRMLAGGTYVNDFFENVPPFFFYLYFPVIWINKLFSWNLAILTYVYIFIFSFISFLLCHELIKKNFPEEKYFSSLFSLVLLSCFILLPLPVAVQLGQKENMMVIFTMPYFLLICSRLRNIKISTLKAATIGLFASLGFAIKPYFLLFFIVTECYFVFVALASRRRPIPFRPENLAILAVVSIYLVSIFLFHPNYIDTIVPFASHLYYQGFRVGSFVFYTPQVIYCYFSIVFYLIAYPALKHKNLATILWLVLLSSLAIYFFQGINFSYHMFPATAFSITLNVLLLQGLATKKLNELQYLFLYIFMFAFGFYTGFFYSAVPFSIVLYTPLFFAFLTGISFVFLYLSKLRSFYLACAGLSVLVLSYLFFYMINKTDWNMHQFAATLIFSMLIFLFCAKDNKFHLLFFAALSCIIFAGPLATLAYHFSSKYEKNDTQFASFVATHAKHQKIYVFSTFFGDTYPMPYYSQAILASRFAVMWPLPGLLKTPINQQKESKYLNNKSFFINMITTDLQQRKPDWVFVDMREKKGYLNQPFDYISYFSASPEFKKIWSHYQYITTVEGKSHSHFAVYQLRS